MPTKINRAGKQQNYVPAGHGDASGEYGDNESGSNIHFKNFEKPKEQPKKETRSKELTKKQIQEIGTFVNDRKKLAETNENNFYDSTIRALRYYGGNFGDLSSFTDEELKDIIDEFREIKKSNSPVYIYDRGKWKMSFYPELLDKAGIEYFTKDEKELKEKEKNIELVEKSQNESDKKIQNTLGEKSVVCFGKGYSKDDLEQIEKDTETYVNDFPELKDEIKMMGDRNNLEKYVNALRKGQTPSEEDITKEMARIKKFSWDTPPESELRERAIRNLKSPLKLTRLNNAYAYWDGGNHAMVYMGKMKKLTDEQKDYEFKNNFKSSDKRNATFCHEMGHATYSALKNFVKSTIDKMNNDYSKLTEMSERNKIGPKIRQLEILRDDFESRLSFYKNQNLNQNYSKEFNEAYKQKTGLDYGISSYNRDKYEAEKEVTKELQNKGIKKYNISKYGATNKDEFIAECFSAHYTGMNNELATNVVNLFKQYSKDVREVLK